MYAKSFLRFLSACLAAVGFTNAAGTLTQITDFGANPGGTFMYLYTPVTVAAKPGIVVAVHHCQGTAQGYYGETSSFAALADKYGFYMIYPGANHPDLAADQKQCFDVYSTEALTHDGGSDPTSIVNMVKWVVKNKNADSTRVYVLGSSSGAMMTNVMAGSYPDVFKAGAAYSGVPFACFAGTGPWSNTCAAGKLLHTPQEWGDLVRAAYPGYTGPRPRMQLWHGDQDGTLSTPNFNEEIDEWTNVLGVARAPSDSVVGSPKANWIHTKYKDGKGVVQVDAILEVGLGHGTTMFADSTIKFFGLDQPAAVAVGSAPENSLAGSLHAVPFAGGMRFTAQAAGYGNLSLDIFSAAGRRVATLHGESVSNGTLEFSWQAGESVSLAAMGSPASPGVYFAALRRDGRSACGIPFVLTR